MNEIPPALGEAEASVPVLSSDNVRAEADALMFDAEGPYWQTGHRMHKATVEKVTALLGQALGDEPAYDALGNSADFSNLLSSALEPPADPTDYDFSDITLTDGEEWNGSLEAEARDWFYRAGVSVAEQKGFMERYQKVSSMPEEDREQMRLDATASLERSWGADFESNLDIVEDTVDALGESFRQTLLGSGMNNDVGAITALLRIGRLKGIG